jgi:seryl-tRNA synthetase
MSLEQQIERLTAAIEKLNGNIERALATPAAVQMPVESAPAVETVKAEQHEVAVTVTVESVQSQCLAATRKDLANKAKIRDWLDSFKAKKVADLTAEQLLELSTKLERL